MDECTQAGKHSGLFYDCKHGEIIIKCRTCGKVWVSECTKYLQELKEKVIRERGVDSAE